MNYDTFIDQVAARSRLSPDRAVELARAVLATLADRMTGGEALDLAAQLPMPLQPVLRPRPRDEAGDRFGAAEFLRRVRDRTGVDQPTAETAVRAVFTTLREALSGGEFDDVVTQLPRDYREMVEPSLTPGATSRRD